MAVGTSPHPLPGLQRQLQPALPQRHQSLCFSRGRVKGRGMRGQTSTMCPPPPLPPPSAPFPEEMGDVMGSSPPPLPHKLDRLTVHPSPPPHCSLPCHPLTSPHCPPTPRTAAHRRYHRTAPPAHKMHVIESPALLCKPRERKVQPPVTPRVWLGRYTGPMASCPAPWPPPGGITGAGGGSAHKPRCGMQKLTANLQTLRGKKQQSNKVRTKGSLMTSS